MAIARKASRRERKTLWSAQATTGTTTYTSAIYEWPAPDEMISGTGIGVDFQSVETSATHAGTLKLYVTLDNIGKVRDGSATYRQITSASFTNHGGTSITFTTGNGAVSGSTTSLFVLSFNLNNFSALKWEWVNATGEGTITLKM